MKFAFLGSSKFSTIVLDELEKAGFIPTLIVTSPDKPKGRKLEMSPSLVSEWAKDREIKTFRPEKLDHNLARELRLENFDLFIVASYGKIIPKEIIDIPKKGTLNVHPSLLPRLRGASPIQGAILTEDITGVTIMKVDEKMDHGPIIAQEIVETEKWPLKYSELEKILAERGGHLLAETIAQWLDGNIDEQEQDHDQATYTKKIEKEDALIDLNEDPKENYRKICAFEVWPKPYFFTEKKGKKIRVIIKDAKIENGELLITRVLPEGRKETDYKNFLEN